MRYCLPLAVLLTLAPALLGAEPAAVRALEHLKPRTDSGPFSWTAGPYLYDGAGNITSIGSESFVYDKLGRLRSASVRGPDLSSFQTQELTYDVYGNLTSTSKLGQTLLLPVHANTNRLEDIEYDASGNVTVLGTQHLSYDAVGVLNTIRLSTSGQPRIVYAYTADDERLLSFDVATGTTHWTLRGLDNKVLRDFRQQGNSWSVERDYVYRDGLLLAALKSNGAVEHYTLDHLGTPRLITDGSGHKVGYHAYWPFGEEWTSDTAQEGNPLQFTGHERDADPSTGAAGLDYMHARYYRAGWGRFLMVDPAMDLQKTPPNPQMWNRYAYVTNDPLRFTDPTGREHVQEPGFTKPLSEADWSDAPPAVKAAFQAEGALVFFAGDEFVAGPVAGRAFAAVGRVFGAISEELALSRSIMTALKSTNAATRLEGEAAAALSESVTGFRRVVKGVGEVDVETTKAIIEVTGGRSGKLAQVNKLLNNKTINPQGKPVIVYGPCLGLHAARTLERAGATVVRTLDELKAAAQ